MYRRMEMVNKPAGVLQLVNPPSLRKEILEQAHAGFTGGHLGEKRTMEQVRRQAYWIE